MLIVHLENLFCAVSIILLLLLLSLFSRVQPCVTPWTAAHQAPLSLGAGVQPRWIQGDLKAGTELASLEKYIFNHRYREIRNG